MRKAIVIVLIGIFLFSCDSAKKALQRGSYAQACMMAVKKLQKKPGDEEHAEIFTIAYQKANQKDLDRVDYLKLSGEETSWDEIYKIYKRLDRRQQLAETVLPIRAGGKTVNFEHINYNAKLIEAKNSAADFHYNKGMELINGGKPEARMAYNHFVKVRNYTNSYNDLEQKIKEAKEKGTIYVHIGTVNKTYTQLSPEFLNNLVDFGMEQFDDKWIRYYNTPVKKQFDYNIFVAINSIYISPNEMKESKKIVKKEVRDGWQYEFDSRGNVKKDTLGNDIKKPKYKTISCTLTSKIQKKLSSIKTKIDIQDNKTKRIVASIPEETKYEFNFVSSFANGDLNALDQDTRKSIGKSPVAFPADIEMINYAGGKLKERIVQTIKRNRNKIK